GLGLLAGASWAQGLRAEARGLKFNSAMPNLALLLAAHAWAANVAAPARLGSPEQPLRVAVVGAGPAGFYAAGALLNQKDVAVTVDVFDRLPSPYGLV